MKFCKVSLFLILLVAVCLPAVAQAQIQLNIPFNFFTAGKSLPAGHYQAERVLDGSEVWRIFNNRGQTMVFLANSVLSLKTPHRPSLVLRNAGTTYSLVQIWPTRCTTLYDSYLAFFAAVDCYRDAVEVASAGGSMIGAVTIAICGVGVVFSTICIIGFRGDLKREKNNLRSW